jgi:hypothetical protein
LLPRAMGIEASGLHGRLDGLWGTCMLVDMDRGPGDGVHAPVHRDMAEP